MRRNLIIIVCIFLGIIGLMLTGNIIIIGEKLAQITHLWVAEYIFYALILLLLCYLVGVPLFRIHHAPPFPVLDVPAKSNERQLQTFGKTLCSNCGYIPDKEQRKAHQEQLKLDLLHASGDEARLQEVIGQEIALRFDGQKEIGVIGINRRIVEWGKTVFMVSAISQNARFDTLSVMFMNYKMMQDLIDASGFRPITSQLVRMYGSFLTTALITYAMSEALSSTGSVAPFDFGDLDHHADAADAAANGVSDVDLDDVGFDDQLTDTEGLSIYSILRRVKIPGVVVSSALDGTVNALMTLRIGFIMRTYLQKGPKALSGFKNKRSVKFQAMKEALQTIPSVIVSGSSVVGKRTSKLLVKLVQRHNVQQ